MVFSKPVRVGATGVSPVLLSSEGLHGIRHFNVPKANDFECPSPEYRYQMTRARTSLSSGLVRIAQGTCRRSTGLAPVAPRDFAPLSSRDLYRRPPGPERLIVSRNWEDRYPDCRLREHRRVGRAFSRGLNRDAILAPLPSPSPGRVENELASFRKGLRRAPEDPPRPFAAHGRPSQREGEVNRAASRIALRAMTRALVYPPVRTISFICPSETTVQIHGRFGYNRRLR